MKKIIVTVISLISILIFSGCAAQTLIEKRNLDVQTKMSASIFLEPVSIDKQIVYIRVRNTTDKDINIEETIKKSFEYKGFKVTTNPDEAYFMVQANLLQIGKTNANGARNALQSTFGGAIVGGGISVATGGGIRDTSKAALIGGALSFLGDAMVKDVYYTMITDVEIRQRPLIGETVTQNSNIKTSQGLSGNETQTIKSDYVKWKKYRTRVVSVANKVNLEFEESKPKLINGLARSISGLL